MTRITVCAVGSDDLSTGLTGVSRPLGYANSARRVIKRPCLIPRGEETVPGIVGADLESSWQG
jgi:hypothetical protein